MTEVIKRKKKGLRIPPQVILEKLAPTVNYQGPKNMKAFTEFLHQVLLLTCQWIL